MSHISDLELAHRQYRAKLYVLDIFIDWCKQSPLADDPEDFAENANDVFNGEDLEDAINSLRHMLESLKNYL